MGGEGCWTWAGRGGVGSPLLPSSLPIAHTQQDAALWSSPACPCVVWWLLVV